MFFCINITFLSCVLCHVKDYWSAGRIGFTLCEVIRLRLWWKSTQSLTGRALCWRCHVPPTSSCRGPLTEIEDEASEWLTGAGWMRSVVTEGVELVVVVVEEVDSRWSWSARCTAPGGSRTPWGRTCRRSSSSGGDVGSGRWRKLWTDLRRKRQHDESHAHSSSILIPQALFIICQTLFTSCYHTEAQR